MQQARLESEKPQCLGVRYAGRKASTEQCVAAPREQMISRLELGRLRLGDIVLTCSPVLHALPAERPPLLSQRVDVCRSHAERFAERFDFLRRLCGNHCADPAVAFFAFHVGFYTDRATPAQEQPVDAEQACDGATAREESACVWSYFRASEQLNYSRMKIPRRSDESDAGLARALRRVRAVQPRAVQTLALRTKHQIRYEAGPTRHAGARDHGPPKGR